MKVSEQLQLDVVEELSHAPEVDSVLFAIGAAQPVMGRTEGEP